MSQNSRFGNTESWFSACETKSGDLRHFLIWAVEVKHGVAPKFGKHFNQICDDAGATQTYIVYGGDDEFPTKNDVRMIFLEKLMQKLTISEK